eukprot:s444_g15.t1
MTPGQLVLRPGSVQKRVRSRECRSTKPSKRVDSLASCRFIFVYLINSTLIFNAPLTHFPPLVLHFCLLPLPPKAQCHCRVRALHEICRHQSLITNT